MNAGEVADLIGRYNDAWNAQDSRRSTRCTIRRSSSTTTPPASAPRARTPCASTSSGSSRNNPGMTFRTRSMHAGEDFAVCEWTLNVEKDGKKLEWDGVDVFPIRNGLIARKDVYSASHRARER